jgi:hypothetical protein
MWRLVVVFTFDFYLALAVHGLALSYLLCEESILRQLIPFVC